MMSLIDFFKNLFQKSEENLKEAIEEEKKLYKKEHNIPQERENIEETPEKEENEIETKIISIWDVIKCNEYTQAYHLVSVIPYDEWIDMTEIRRRIWDLFQIEYKNDRSLYPYLKTMVDLGLIETNNIGGKRKWRKKDLLIKMNEKKEKSTEISQKLETSIKTE
jgi:hypothetical protein